MTATPSNGQPEPSLEFRVPIAPTRSFFHQVRFFDASLRRLGGVYEQALLRVIVGDHARIPDVVAANEWSVGRRIEWIAVPDDVLERYGMHGTADYRYAPEAKADIVILSDADTVLARPLTPLFQLLADPSPAAAGHMAHFPPPAGQHGPLTNVTEKTLWPALLEAFGLPMPAELHPYSMDPDNRFAPAPAYFNLGFVAFNPAALAVMGRSIFPMQDRLLELFPSHMRCQIAVTLIALESGIALATLPAEFNLANDVGHLACNGLAADDARVIHYLRGDELRREEIVLPENIPAVLAAHFDNPVNRRLQELLAEYARREFGLK
jgi:hypothetical protein